MGFIDALFISIISALTCLGLPKFLSLLASFQAKPRKPALMDVRLNTENVAVTSFPYCTVYPITGTQFCKFSPQFCSRCSPYL